jgi:ribosomal protein L7/L12
MGIFSDSNNDAVMARLARVERKLDAIIAFLQIRMPEDDHADIRAMIAAGDKIGAIKAYRERTGMGLAEAKQAVERGL